MKTILILQTHPERPYVPPGVHRLYIGLNSPIKSQTVFRMGKKVRPNNIAI